MTKTLTLMSDSFDQENTFLFAYTNFRGVERTGAAYILHDQKNGKFIIMQRSTCMKDVYTEADIAERNRLNSEKPVRDGDLVEVRGLVYSVRIVGNYSDAGYLVPTSSAGVDAAEADIEAYQIKELQNEIELLKIQNAMSMQHLNNLRQSA